MGTQIKAKVLHKEWRDFFFVLFLISFEAHFGCVFHSGTGTGFHGQVRWARPTNTCVFTYRENRRLIIRGEVHFAMHDTPPPHSTPPPFPLPRCQNFIINSLKCFQGYRGGGSRETPPLWFLISCYQEREDEAKHTTHCDHRCRDGSRWGWWCGRQEGGLLAGGSSPPPPQRSHHVWRMTLAWTHVCYLFIFFSYFFFRFPSPLQRLHSVQTLGGNKLVPWNNYPAAPSECELWEPSTCMVEAWRARRVSRGGNMCCSLPEPH